MGYEKYVKCWLGFSGNIWREEPFGKRWLIRICKGNIKMDLKYRVQMYASGSEYSSVVCCYIRGKRICSWVTDWHFAVEEPEFN